MNGSLRPAALAAAALFVVLPAGLAALTVVDLVAASQTRALDVQRARQLDALDARLARLGVAGGDPIDFSAIYLHAASAALAAADLQQRLVAAVADAGGDVVETEVAERPAEAPVDEVAVRLVLEADNEAIATLVSGIETGVPLLFIDALAIRRQQGPADGEEVDNPRLRAELTVRAAWKEP